MRTRRWLTTIIGGVSGVCFAALTARSISVLAITPHFFRLSSLVYAIITGYLSYVAVRAATSGRTDAATFQGAVMGGFYGALAGFVVVVAAYAMFNQTSRAYFAHPLGWHFQQVTMGRLVVSWLCLGFGAGFTLRMQTLRTRKS